MDEFAAGAFSVGTLAGGVVYGIAYARHHNGDWGELGPVAALIGLILFAGLWGLMIFIYGSLSKLIHRDERKTSASGVAALLGVPFWFVVMPCHEYLRDVRGLPDALFWIEAFVFCGLSFEILRAIATTFHRHQASHWGSN